MRKPRVYVSGPMAGAPGSSYTANIRQGIDAAEALERMGAVPYLPHTNALWGLVYPGKDYETIIARDLAWVEACDALVRLPGTSKGAALEVEHAWEIGIPVFFVHAFFFREHDNDPQQVTVVETECGVSPPVKLTDFIKNFKPSEVRS